MMRQLIKHFVPIHKIGNLKKTRPVQIQNLCFAFENSMSCQIQNHQRHI